MNKKKNKAYRYALSAAVYAFLQRITYSERKLLDKNSKENP